MLNTGLFAGANLRLCVTCGIIGSVAALEHTPCSPGRPSHAVRTIDVESAASHSDYARCGDALELRAIVDERLECVAVANLANLERDGAEARRTADRLRRDVDVYAKTFNALAEVVGAGQGEPVLDAARRVVRERDAARAHADDSRTVLQELRAVLGAKDGENVVAVAKAWAPAKPRNPCEACGTAPAVHYSALARKRLCAACLKASVAAAGEAPKLHMEPEEAATVVFRLPEAWPRKELRRPGSWRRRLTYGLAAATALAGAAAAAVQSGALEQAAALLGGR